MRKIISALIFLTILPVLSHAFTVDGISYSITSTDDKTVKVVANASGYSGNVTIPSEVTYKDVTYTVTAIGSAAFNDDTELVSVSLPSTIKTIEHAAFCRSSIQSLTLPEGVTTIASAAFKNCTSLKSVNIPSTVNKIGDFAFYGCSNLEGDIVIPDGVEEIEYQAFYGCSKITSVTIPNSVTSIDHEAFMDCTGLTGKVTIPEGVTSIATHAFYNCTGITEFVLPSTLTEIGSWAFSGCTALETVNLPDGLTAIELRAFYGCTSLKSDIVVPEGVTELGYGVFGHCSSLTNVTLPSTLTSIGDLLFYDCSSLESVNIPESVTNIGREAFRDCANLTGTISIPSTMTEIPARAFYGCTSVTKFVIPETVVKIGAYAFGTCTALESINLPNSLTEIGNYTFRDCPSLTGDITVPASVTKLGKGLFSGCTGLENVKILANITKIDTLMFAGCTSLVNVDYPASVNTICFEAFKGCTSLKDIVLGANITALDNRAFADCTGLESVTCQSVTAPVCKTDASFTDFSAMLNVPAGSDDEYSVAPTWRKFYEQNAKTVWTGAADNDWTNKDNWTRSVPSKKMGRVAVITKVGSEVTLPDGTVVTVANYPIIAGTRNGSDISYSNTAECDTIVFEPGAGVLGLQNLDYNKAFVKTRININRWYMVSGPLKEMYTGDFYFSGSPVTYLSKFNDALSKTDPSQSIYWFQSCTMLDEALMPGEGFAFKAYRHGGDPSEIVDVTFPRTDEDGNLVTSLYKFNPLNGNLLKSAVRTLAKTDKAYRFVVEDDYDNMPSTYSVELSNKGDYNLIANPVMTHLDIASFINDNSDVIENGIILVSEDNNNISIISNGSEIVSASPTGETMIAPMQSFFVKRKSDISSSVTFDLENNFTTDNTGNCVLKKSELSSNPALYVSAKNASGFKSYVSLWLNSKASNGFSNGEDAVKIFSVNSENEIYTEADGKMLDISQFSALPYEAPLSVSADKQGEVTLSFSGAENFENVDVLLINKQTGEQLNLKNESSYKFAFDANTAKGSLFIRFQSSSEIATGAAMASDSSLKIFSAGSKVKVIGSADNTISEVSVFDAAGRTIVSQKLGNATEYESAAMSGNVVVKVVSERGTTVQKLSIR
ncbi:MAG: leucine-rich repeat domain-containing protein [Paludibacteraceae bacterium]|nr:leucine-rich repeat domain-containing protein [Paludibacteraceae bacterium]